MEKDMLESPIIRRARERSPNYYCLVRVRNISDDDAFHLPKWEVMRNWYKKLEAGDYQWLDLALQTISNAILNQERIYFAVTRDTIRDLLRSDKNWEGKKGLGMKNSYYELLLQEMVDSKMFEAYAENTKLKELKKPRIFKVVDKTLLSLMNAIPEDIQLKEIIEFIKKDDLIRDDSTSEEDTGDDVGDNQGDNVGDKVGDVEIRNKKLETKNQAESIPNPSFEESNKIDIKQLLLKELPDELPDFKQIPELAGLIVSNCDVDVPVTSIFEKHLLSRINSKPTTRQKNYIKNLVSSLQKELEKYQVSNIKLKPAVKLAPKSIRSQVESEQQVEDATLKMLNNFFGKENVKILRSRLTQVEDEQEKFEIQREIDFWESVV